jgi:hypothetical protein
MQNLESRKSIGYTNKNMKGFIRHSLVGIAIIIATLCLSVVAFYIPQKNHAPTTSPLTENVTPMVKMDPMYSIPLGDDRVLMGASHNVFVAKVISQIGTKSESVGGGRTFPVTQFSVELIYNIKGNLGGTITVEQIGGYQNGALMVSDGGDVFGPANKPGDGYLMQPGMTYLLSTRRVNDSTYYLWDFPTASKLVSQDSNLNDSQLQLLAKGDPRVRQLEAAYPNEILVADDVRTGNARNSYLSTHSALPPPPVPPSHPTSTVVVSPPDISNFAITVATGTVTVSWTTSEPTTSQVHFGPSTAMAENAVPDMTFRTSHSLVVSGLVPRTTYYYEVQSTDPSGNIGSSAQKSFTTVTE